MFRYSNLLLHSRFRHEYLKNKLDRYKKYEEYLLKVLDILPARKYALSGRTSLLLPSLRVLCSPFN